ncbi:hypothetical protein AYL99_09620 [Fonsecaea erecta]|uniref:Uncharacterized protein n=1 Tax=Fonsecaea erecta TaxID=1367422 RepID=A0A178ZAE2_9EURO|nr:hypothetical protein AYL99_09620 [Fonsecaea erecta]OAP56441.1 hypothetical protein AYL99_09620 [Fonsecaea erecta]
MATQQNTGSGQSTLAVSPSLIVGIVILAAFACIIIFASIFRYCRRGQSSLSDPDALDDMGGTEFYNPNKQRSASQVARLREVRWINNMYAWERGRQARMEVGELRPTTMLVGKKGESRSWDEYSVTGDNPWQNIMGNGTAGSEVSPASYFYNLDNPYPRSSSQQRLSHLAPPSEQYRNSYHSTASGNGYLPRHPSTLLPPPIGHTRRDSPGITGPRSPLRNEYQYDGHEPDPSAVFDAGPQDMFHRPRADSMHHVESHSPFVNPRITVSDESQAAAYVHSPTAMADDDNFETVTLDGNDSPEDHGVDKSPHNPKSPSPSPSPELRDHRPSVIVLNDEPYPPFQLQFLTQSLSQNSVSVYGDDEDEAGKYHGVNEQSSWHAADGESEGYNAQLEEVDHNTKGGNEISRENVKGMIHQWERANGSYGTSHSAAS